MSGAIWSDERLSPNKQEGEAAPAYRSRHQQDYDRLLFSTPVRRLSDKTQVWPMEENDGVRTRLTHSHEVANLARSIGARVYSRDKSVFGNVDLHGSICPLLLAIGLSHDLGNPPFGHRGEAAIGAWFKARPWLFTHKVEEGGKLEQPVPEKLQIEFTEFDGNPQTFRLLTKLQTSIAHAGLDLTAATLAASLKYPVGAARKDKSNPIAKKYGYFESERSAVNWVRAKTGLSEGQRHPLTWIMEACDDIAYSVLDVDDAMKKGVISPDDALMILRTSSIDKDLCEKISASFDKTNSAGRRPEIARDIKIGYLRAHLIDHLVGEAADAFFSFKDEIFAHDLMRPLMDQSPTCDALKGIAQQYAFGNSGVLRMEALGGEAIDVLMTAFWSAIKNRKDHNNFLSQREEAKDRYVYSKISPNYLEEASKADFPHDVSGSIRYRELRLLTDMVSGMTDTFAIKMAADFALLK